ncbi:RNA methyltransferase [Halothermothrix orenii]|uniref:Uncharacterized protein conserved in bacteria n=1 Tax=Halothermothrix orenii (strain H 168 / OCM 544 / DSM 9562) TaxID=373903 RepID=B8CW22_HALOH|nr:RNA methyltransferase [Halothermothrix orenii]ACL69491.1 uncharacterized protein conserved in bacteria [Halothermothrix orenii H 168]
MTKDHPKIYLGLLHYPIYNKQKKVITTTITNLDVHDIARAGKTYDITKYYVINPLKSQRELIEKMRRYWTSDYGKEYIPNRHEAFSVLQLAETLDAVIDEIKEETGVRPKLIATDARQFSNSISYKKMREVIFNSPDPYLIIFGTGWGLTEETINKCDYILEPIYGRGEFNHLSVRSAASIILDRLLCDPWWE